MLFLLFFGVDPVGVVALVVLLHAQPLLVFVHMSTSPINKNERKNKKSFRKNLVHDDEQIYKERFFPCVPVVNRKQKGGEKKNPKKMYLYIKKKTFG